MRRLALLAAVLLCAACASSVPYSEVRGDLALGDRAWLSELQPTKLTRAVRVGIAPPLRPRWYYDSGPSWDVWSAEERELIDRWVGEATSRGMITNATYLPRLIVSADAETRDVIGDVARGARAAGVDAVLLVQTSVRRSSGVNPLGVFYLTIVGCWFVPGTDIRSAAVAEGVLLGADGRALHGFGEGLGREERTRPAAYADADEVDRVAITRALDALGARLLEAKP